MSEGQINQGTQDSAGVGDEVSVNRPNPDITLADDGMIIYPEGVKGPDPDVWGPDEERPDPFLSEFPGQEGVPLDTVTEDGVKGPSSDQWEQDDQGRYVNR